MYFGYARDAPGRSAVRRSDVAGVMMIDVNRVAVDNRVAQMLIVVNPLDTKVHTSLARASAVANENPFVAE